MGIGNQEEKDLGWRSGSSAGGADGRQAPDGGTPHGKNFIILDSTPSSYNTECTHLVNLIQLVGQLSCAAIIVSI